METRYGPRGCGTLKLIYERKVGESILPANKLFKKFAFILCLRFTNEASSSRLAPEV